MKTNTPIIRRFLAIAVVLLSIFTGLLSCDSTEPVKPKSAYGPIGPPVIADTLVTDPNDPQPVPIPINEANDEL